LHHLLHAAMWAIALWSALWLIIGIGIGRLTKRR
jgi:hypothetical protein